jgi:hypothetical protein
MKPVTLSISWYQLFGNKQVEIPDNIRRERWESWKQLAIADGGQKAVEYWSDASECNGCTNKNGDWCKLMQLPCSVNPILTFRDNMIGLACMGAGRNEIPKQLELW